MSERDRPGLFGRWFKGGGQPGEVEESREAERPVPGPAGDAGGAAPDEAAPAGADAPSEPAEEARSVEAAESAGPVDAAPTEPDATSAASPADEPPATAGRSWFQRLTAGLSRSSGALTGNLTGILTKRRLDEETLQDLEDVLIQADLGVETATRITEALAAGRYDREIGAAEVRAVLAEEVSRVLAPVARPLKIDRTHAPHVILVVGVNGAGKTTTIGKLARKFRADGMRVVLGAGDTFRAAAVEQLQIWGQRTGAEVIARPQGADSAGLAFDALTRARETGADVMMLDTAGRLQNKADLMGELEKIVRVLKKQDPAAPHSVLLVLDATTGQNAMSQVEIFRRVCGVTGLVMTKLDGTARGGILVAIAARHALPVHFIGVGEGVEDLQPFDAGEFAQAIAGGAAHEEEA